MATAHAPASSFAVPKARPPDEVRVIAVSGPPLGWQDCKELEGKRKQDWLVPEKPFIGVLLVVLFLLFDLHLDRKATTITIVAHKWYLRIPAWVIAVLLRIRFRHVHTNQMRSIRRFSRWWRRAR